MFEHGVTTRISQSALLRFIGNTPLLRLARIGADRLNPAVRLFAKAEWYNPGGSIKDRAALNMISEGESNGKLKPGMTIIEATSGNTGIALATIGAVLGYRVRLAVPANASQERRLILQALGADVIYTDPLEGTDGAQDEVRRIVEADPETYFYPDQYNNPANWQAHYKTTAEEMIKQTEGSITHFVAGLGTTGTFVGTSRRLKEFDEHIRCVAVEPDSPMHALEGLKHLASARVPGIYDAKLADARMEVSTEEAFATMQRLAREEGILVGPSAGAALAASLRVAETLEQGTVVTIFSDSGMKYLDHFAQGANNGA